MKIISITKDPYDGEKIISFEHNDKVYVMNSDELEAAYRCQERCYRLQDAMSHLNILVYGVDENDGQLVDEDEESNDDRENRLMFEATYGVPYKEASAQTALNAYVDRFEEDFDCGVDEDAQWEHAILRALTEEF